MRIFCCLYLCVSMLYAGGGPEAVALIVNQNDEGSREIANYYATLHGIPDSNIIYLSDVPAENTITLEQFRTQIIGPILKEIQERQLSGQIDYITYSCGFPTRVTFDRQFSNKLYWVANPQASLTGLTYLFQLSIKDEKAFLDPACNFYFRQSRIDMQVDDNIKQATSEDTKPVDDFFRQKMIRDNKRNKEKAQKTDADILWEKEGWENACKHLAALAKTFPRNPSLLYNLACTQAMTGDPDAAMISLKTCTSNGYANWPHMRSDGDLASLYQREDFKQLIEQLKQMPLHCLPSLGFSSRFAFNKQGTVVAADQGLHYFISTMLGYTGERGNTIAEIKSCLKSAAAADATQAKGCFYFPINGDIRSKTREWAVYHCAKVLQAQGHQAKVFSGLIPKQASDVIGIHAGTASFDWSGSESQMLPGAIAEHLTSWGAEFDRQGQTKISAWIRAGAAGSSGTISEPYALQYKFPDAFLYVHYANGCSLGESFYQSVASPYELLILGDALCQPFARLNTITVPEMKETVNTTVELNIQSTQPYLAYMALLDGRVIKTGTSENTLTLDPATFPAGFHDLRIVTMDKTPVQTRSSVVLTFESGNKKYIKQCSVDLKDDTCIITYACNTDDQFGSIAFLHHGRLISSSSDSDGTIIINKNKLGAGPIVLKPEIRTKDAKTLYFGQSLEFEW